MAVDNKHTLSAAEAVVGKIVNPEGPYTMGGFVNVSNKVQHEQICNLLEAILEQLKSIDSRFPYDDGSI